MRFKQWFVVSCLLLSGCLSSVPIPTPELRASQAAQLAKSAGWKEQIIYTPLFSLKAFGSEADSRTRILTIYIEGDGLAWLSENSPSSNPSPIIPTLLLMAIQDKKNKSVVYLARPCQFVFKDAWRSCRHDYWTHLRFSPEVIDSMNQGVEHLKQYYHAQQIILIGYSGGGTIATLLSARRTDVIQLITVAAILDTEHWVKQENLTPLYGSLNPADEWKNLVSIPQTHWVGGQDNVVSKDVAVAFAQRFPTPDKPQIKVVPGFSHTCCWVRDWTSLLSSSGTRQQTANRLKE